jgi:wobble nucleotide-excising tRNase
MRHQIKNIKKIKHQIFKDFSWSETTLGCFDQYNIIYGWNGTGKTTLSNLFRKIEKGETLTNPSQVVFQLKANNSFIDLSKAEQNQEVRVKVFNRNYVEDTIFKSNTGEGITPVFLLGEDAKNLQIKWDEKNKFLQELNTQHRNKTSERESIVKTYSTIASNQAKCISNTLSVLANYKRYDKSNFEKELLNINCENYLNFTLDDSKLRELLTIVQSTSKETITNVLFDFKLAELKTIVESLCQKTIIQTQSIIVLQENQPLANWIETGLKLHTHNDVLSEDCLFCKGKLNQEAMKSFQEHFNDNYQAFKQEINIKLQSLAQSKNNLSNWGRVLPFKEKFYDSFYTQIEIVLKQLNCYEKEVQDFLVDCEKHLEAKKNCHLFTHYTDFTLKLPQDITPHINRLNQIIEEHNTRTVNLEVDKKTASARIEKHFIVEVFLKYNEEKQKEQDCLQELSQLTVNICSTTNEIRSLEKQINNSLTFADKLNKALSQYLGRNEIRLTVNLTNTGYEIRRGQQVVNNDLSEGEKTSLALLYFLESLSTEDLSKIIVVIDDPVSSLDDNLLYQAVVYLSNRLRGVNQLFILTHQHSFFRQIKKQFNDSKLFVIESIINKNEERSSSIKKMNSLLEKYESEYHYLFHYVYSAVFNETNDCETYYHSINTARKLLEAFLSFKCGNSGKDALSGLIDKIPKDTKDEHQELISRVNQFLNTNSHQNWIPCNSSFTGLSETISVLTDVLKLIEILDHIHYDAMVASGNNNLKKNPTNALVCPAR